MRSEAARARWMSRNLAARERARQIVLRLGWNASAYQILNPGLSLWFSRHEDAVVGFVLASRVRVVAGAPVCAPERLPEVVREFEADSRRRGHGVCYFGAARRLEDLLRHRPNYSRVVLGAQPVWNPRGWSLLMQGHASLRSQVRRATRKGARACEWSALEAAQSASLWVCASRWIASRGLPPLHFLVETRILDDLRDRRLWVALAPSGSGEEEVVAFVVASPVPARGGWLLEQFVRSPQAPNGTVEMLIDAAMQQLGDEGALYVSMGLSPLSRLEEGQGEKPLEPVWLRALFPLVRAHGRRFYNFDGLEAFKAKLRPHDWEPVWAISREKTFSLRTLWAIVGAFGRQPPPRLLAQVLGRALVQEWKWLRFKAK